MSHAPAAEPAQTLDAMVHFVAGELEPCVGAAGLAALSRRAASVPLAAARLLGVEVPLGVTRGPADLLVSLSGARQLSAFGVRDGELAESLGGGAQLEALLRALCHASDPMYGRLAHAWLEYDVGSGDPWTPSLFAGPKAPSDTVAVAHLLAGGSLDRLRSSRIRALVGELGSGAVVNQVGVMHGRADADVRLVLTPRRGFAGALRAAARAGWDGPLGNAQEVFDRYGTLVAGPSLALAVGADGAFASPAGVELHLHTLDGTARLLSALARDGLADPALVESLLRWHGHADDVEGGVTPAGFAVAAELTRGRAWTTIVRRVHHVKLSVGRAAPVSAKAYLGAQPYLAL
jgi:hypothetical protein